MPINISVPDLAELKPRITVFGVGGGGCNAVNNMISSNLSGVEFVVANTDAQALAKSPCERKIQMGVSITQGLGAGAQPEIGAAAAEETKNEIVDHLAGSHMVFITACMGGGTGTGAAPVIASLAREQGILTVGVVTKPFDFEGRRRMAIAERGIENLAQNVDTLIVIPNQNLFRVANEATSFTAAFQMADQVLFSGVASITELMTKEGLINLDFADVRAVMSDMGKAMMGTGEASGENRAEEAALAAISNPLLDIDSMAGARGVLISIAGGPDLTLYEVDQAASRIREEVDPEANIIVGATIEEDLEGTMRVSVVATGLQQEMQQDGELEKGTNGPRTNMTPGMAVPGMAGGMQSLPPKVHCRPVGKEEAPAAEGKSVERQSESTAGTSAAQAGGKEQPAAEAELPLTMAQESVDERRGDASRGHEKPAVDQVPLGQGSGQPPKPAAAHADDMPPVATGRQASSQVPGLEEMPEQIRQLAEEKRIRILAAAGQNPGSEPVATRVPSSNTRAREGFISKVKDLFGRGQAAPQAGGRPSESEPQMRMAQSPAGNASGQQAAPSTDGVSSAQPGADAAEMDDDLSIPAFLRRQSS